MAERTFWTELWNAKWALLNGIAITTELSAYVVVASTILGLLGGLVLVYGWRPAALLVRLYVDVMRGIPVLVLILFWYYGLALFKINIPAFWAGVIALAGFATAHMSEIVRGAIQSVPAGQSEAAKAIGLRFWQRLRYVILPQATRRVLPPWVNTAVEMVKATTLLSIIGVVELLLATQQTIARNYMVIQFYLAATLLYFVLNFAISRLGALLERRFAYMRY
ncbi:amino acid ABC transporter permease [Marinimicrococcus flavescens]|uniref:Amino acid ABC transporter permease n=1 Tax=Marinimicrococcus flavescens TaxID=3031815 RepID=A0AAP3UZT9_9PROT|nr:amino acid ABC transporter permease [Marinimicrococcus flavescens]